MELGQSFSISKVGTRLITIGGSIAFLGLLLMLFIYGFTFGTAGIVTVGLTLSFYGITFVTTANKKMELLCGLIRVLCSAILILGVVSFIYIEALIVQSLKSNDNVNIKYVVVLGAGIQGEQPSLTLGRRLDKSIEYLNANPDAQIVASGGFGPEATISEAEVMKRYFVAHGINEARILKEERSATSDENLRYTKELLSGINGDKPQDILVITSDYHMFRAKHIAGKYFSKVYGIASETPTAIMVNYAVREYLAVLKLLALSPYTSSNTGMM